MGHRLHFADDNLTIITKLAEGNLGAVSVLLRSLQEGAAIDPDNAFGGGGAAFALDTDDIYGGRIWQLYKDVCGQDLVRMLGVLRAVQLGLLPRARLQAAIDGQRKVAPAQHPLTAGELDALLVQVRDRLPRFGVQPSHQARTS
jgi:hypothetical protein